MLINDLLHKQMIFFTYEFHTTIRKNKIMTHENRLKRHYISYRSTVGFN